MTIKLSECGFPRRRLWIFASHLLADIQRLVNDLVNHREILAPCPKCKKHEAFEGTLRHQSWGKKRTYVCVACGTEILVEMDVTFGPFKT